MGAHERHMKTLRVQMVMPIEMADPSPLYRKAPKGRNSTNHHAYR